MDAYSELAGYYDLIYAGSWDNDVDFYLREARAAGGPVLEIGCGTGRVLLPLLRAGIDAAGVDSSEPMVRILRAKAAEAGLRPEVAIGDMRDFRINRKFALAIVPYRAFLHMLTPRDRKRALMNIRGHLSAGGRVILHGYRPTPRELACTGGIHHPLEVTEHNDAETGRRFFVRWDLMYSPERRVLDYMLRLEGVDGVQLRAFRMCVAHVGDEEMRRLLSECGFGAVESFGDFNGGPVSGDSGEILWVAAVR